MVSDYRGQSLVRSLQARIAELESGLKAHELGLVRDETIRLQDDRIKRLDAALAKCHKAALPDPYDERDIDIHWLTKTILEITRKARQGNE
jgi:hypothetical protein